VYLVDLRMRRLCQNLYRIYWNVESKGNYTFMYTDEGHALAILFLIFSFLCQCCLWLFEQGLPSDRDLLIAMRDYGFYGFMFTFFYTTACATGTAVASRLNVFEMVDHLVMLTNPPLLQPSIEETEELRLKHYEEALAKEWDVMERYIKELPLLSTIDLCNHFPSSFSPKGATLDRLSLLGYAFSIEGMRPVLKKV
jgi:hypothetical protein